MTTYKDYYQVLGVDRTATGDEIKSAYRALARKHHPDLHQGQDKEAAEEKIKEINEAYEALGDPEKRSKYDLLGSNFSHGQEWQPPPGSDGYQYYNWSSPDNGGDSFGSSDFSDFFDILFGRGAGRGSSGFTGFEGFTQPGATRGDSPGLDAEAELALTLEEAFHGLEKQLQLSTGKVLTVKIPAGTTEGKKIRLKGQGNPGIGNRKPGDLYLKVKLLPHSKFSLQGLDLETELEITPEQAVLGDKVSLSTLQGSVLVTVPPETRSGQKLRLKGKGWTGTNNTSGDLYAKMRINLPSSLQPEEIDLYKKIKAIKQGGEQ